jgi:hypothetical protein
MSKLCKQPNCTRIGSSHCSACQNVSYCSVECQRANWKDHKITCGKELLSEGELLSFLIDVLDKASRLDLEDKRGKNISYLKSAVLFAEYQLGDQVRGECFRRLKNGVIFRNDWLLYDIRSMLIDCYMKQNTAASHDFALGYATETQAQLEIRGSTDGDRKTFSHYVYGVNTHLSNYYTFMARNEEALHHMKEALTAARHIGYENNGESSNLIEALKNMAHISGLIENGEAIKYAEEAYILVSGENAPEHPDVQGAATCLIDTCLETGNFVDAERFARINYECLIDSNNKTDRNSTAFTYAKSQLARVWFKTPPDQRIGGPEAAEEAETLLRESCDIMEKMQRVEGFDDPVTACLSSSHGLLAEVMMARGKKGSEVEKTLLRALVLTKECKVGAVPLVEASHRRYHYLQLLGEFYLVSVRDLVHSGLLEKAKLAYEECVIIATVLYTDGRLPFCLSKVRYINMGLSMFGLEALGKKGGREGGR